MGRLQRARARICPSIGQPNGAESLDAPICQDGRSGRQVCGLARSVVCHHALKDLAGEKAFKTADDLPFGPPFSGASFDVVEGWCVEPHPHDDGPVERGVGLAMTAAVEAVAPRRPDEALHDGSAKDDQQSSPKRRR